MLTKAILQNTSDLIGKELQATDGLLGHVKDFYFDDETWTIRYVVVDTGSWLSGRLVLLAPHAFGEIDPDAEVMRVSLAKQQIENSPSIESHRPISRKYEEEYYSYYEWPTYWGGAGIMGLGLRPTNVPKPQETLPDLKVDAHLRSLLSVKGYHIEATDGSLGHLSGFMIGGAQWKIHELIIETGFWHLGTEMRVSPDCADAISYLNSTISMNVTKDGLLAKEVD